MARPKGSTNKKTVKKVVKEEPSYKAVLKCAGHFYEATGSSIIEAIGNIKPGVARGVTVLTLSKGEKSQARVFHPLMTTRLFNTAGITREILLRNAATRFAL